MTHLFTFLKYFRFISIIHLTFIDIFILGFLFLHTLSFEIKICYMDFNNFYLRSKERSGQDHLTAPVVTIKPEPTSAVTLGEWHAVSPLVK